MLSINKKAQSFKVFILIAVIFIIFIFLIIGLIFFGTTLEKKRNLDITEGNISLYLNAEDFETKTQIPANYLVIVNETILSEGKLDSESLIEIKDMPNSPLKIYCWDESHYLTRDEKNFTNLEKTNNASKFTCNPKPTGNLQITHKGSLNNTESILVFNITTDLYFNKLSAVLSWTTGIINAEFRDIQKQCPSGWKNLPENHYSCENVIEVCKEIKSNNETCVLSEEIPLRFQNQVDSAIYTGKTLNKESYEVIIYVKTEELKTQNDYLEITFYDKDLVHIGNGEFVYLSEYKDINLGNKDFSYKVKYLG